MIPACAGTLEGYAGATPAYAGTLAGFAGATPACAGTAAGCGGMLAEYAGIVPACAGMAGGYAGTVPMCAGTIPACGRKLRMCLRNVRGRRISAKTGRKEEKTRLPVPKPQELMKQARDYRLGGWIPATIRGQTSNLTLSADGRMLTA